MLPLVACREPLSPLVAAVPAEVPEAAARAVPPAAVTQLVTCEGSTQAPVVRCGMPADGGGTPGGAGVLLGGQGTYVRLTGTSPSYTAGTSTYQFSLTVQNLLTQPLGVGTDGTAHADGIRVVLTGARANTGEGSITATGDDTGNFTGVNQPYWQFVGDLANNTTSSVKTVQLTVPSSVLTFSFTMLVSAAIPLESGVLRWTAQSAGSSYGGMFRGMSCTSATHCVAVGCAATCGGASGGEIQVWNGTAWSRSTTTADWLYTVDCTSTTHCLAAGLNGGVHEWDGTSWTQRNSGTGTLFEGLDCTSATHCVLVASDGAIRVWNGSSMSVAATGLGNLIDVSCTSTSFCMATRLYSSALRWDGSSWTDTGGGGRLGITCTGSTHCVAVGSLDGGQGGTITVWNGSGWSSQDSNTASTLEEVSCTSSALCVAVGSGGGMTAWNGTRWTPLASGTGSDFFSVVCTQASSCFTSGAGALLRRGSR